MKKQMMAEHNSQRTSTFDAGSERMRLAAISSSACSRPSPATICTKAATAFYHTRRHRLSAKVLKKSAESEVVKRLNYPTQP